MTLLEIYFEDSAYLEMTMDVRATFMDKVTIVLMAVDGLDWTEIELYFIQRQDKTAILG